MTTRIDLMGGKVQLYQRDTSRFWQARASVGGKQFQFSTKRERLDQASVAAEDWYLTLRGKDRAGVLDTEVAGPDFNKAADLFLREYEVVTLGRRRWLVHEHARGCPALSPATGAREAGRT